ncbi:MAG: 2-C-methyl-D-erythritol 2,4-cyclodiphosphate synthase [Marinilabiliales bacterium]|nr:MAG: 2-C-methyl-D-erythritol 2,4-cyclodiphosphate synthase [Marinilabiliales bacterium]
MHIRCGLGYDVHQLEEGRRLIIGGVAIPHSKGCIAHSDGDVLLHAVCDALLGAASLGDIGTHFPDNDNTYKDIDSKLLLSQTVDLVSEKGYHTGNIDCVVTLQEPKIKDYITAMRKVIGNITGAGPENVSVKATTTERLGFAGREEGVAAWAVATIVPKSMGTPGP